MNDDMKHVLLQEDILFCYKNAKYLLVAIYKTISEE